MSYHQTSPSLPNATFLPGSEGGATLYPWPDGSIRDQYGQVHARANLSARQVKALGLLTSGIYGLPGSILSESADLSESLVSRLQVSCRGGILFRQTWKAKVTPAGRRYWVHIASAHRISDNDCTGWPTPNASNVKGAIISLESIEKRKSKGSQQNLQDIAQLAAWPTPASTDAMRHPGENFTTKNITLNNAAAWATPCQRDYRTANLKSFKERGGGMKGEQWNNQVVHSGPIATGSNAETEKRGQLNPAHSLWLMGYPVTEWESCAGLEMQSCRKSRRNLLKRATE
jgi:hypothetical protein